MAMTAKDPCDHKFQLRLPSELATWLKQRAAENCRSLTGEVYARLKESRKREEEAEGTHAT